MEFFARGPKHPAQNEIHLLPQELVFLPQALVLGFQMLEHFQQALDLLEGDIFAGIFHSIKYTACCVPT
jgi:hypothetical protein